MRKLILIFGTIILCSISTFAEKIDKTTFNKLVDYANCKYTAAYIEIQRQTQEAKGTNDIKLYDKNVKLILENATIEKSPTFEELKELLENNDWKGTFNNLTSKVNDRKTKFTDEMSNSQLIELLKLDGDFATKLKDVINNLQSELKGKFKDKEPAIQPTDTVKISKPTEEKQPIKDASHSLLWLAIGLEFIIILAFAYFLYRLRNRCAKSKNTILEGNGNSGNVEMFDTKIQQLERRLGELTQTVNELQKKLDEYINDNGNIGGNTRGSTGAANENIKYLKGKSGNTFSRIEDSPEGANWCMREIKREWRLEYCGTIETARANFSAIFDNVSKKTGDVQTARKVETAERGILKFDKDNNNWEVTTPAEIKFVK